MLYFFCKNTDEDKNTSESVIRSLLYQLFKSTEDQGPYEVMKEDIGRALDKSGQRRALEFTTMWQLFFAHIQHHSSTMIIVDALDECRNPDLLIQGLISLSTRPSIKIIVTSRKESHLDQHLSDKTSFEVTPEDINADIVAFTEAKISAPSRLSHSLVRNLIHSRLCTAHDGMFLWVHLMLKELSFCHTLSKVREVLAQTPKGLNGIYKTVLQRLRGTLNTATLELYVKVVMWVISAVVRCDSALSQMT